MAFSKIKLGARIEYSLGRGLTLNSENMRSAWHWRRRALAGSASLVALVVAVAVTTPASAARLRYQPEPKQQIQHVNKEDDKRPFGELPKGPMQIFVSINQQKLHLYANGTEVAESLVATGVPQLPTPTGVFSVIGKEKFHRSNIYSGAPMPFMQRITWSGVALHEGENIGHPASHGCIRMPRDFAIKLFNVTKMGVRVIVSKAELKPVPFADPHLFVHKAPAPAAAAPEAAKTTQTTTQATAQTTAQVTAQVNDDTKKTDALAAPAVAAPVAPEPTKTAQVTAQVNDDTKAVDAATPVSTETAKPEAAAMSTATETPSAAQIIDDDHKTVDAAAPAPQLQGVAKSVQPASTDTAELRGSAATPTVSLDHPAEAAAPAATPAPAAPAPAVKPTTLVETAPATKGPIAIFVSRKEKKIYVRQNFVPIFYAPVTISDPDQALGTVVFTAMDLMDDGATFRWNVVSFPGDPPKVKRIVEDHRRGRVVRREELVAAPVVGDLPPPQTPDQVLARIDIPQDVIDRISELMVPGSSLVVSDQGLGEETGEGTDFIIVTRQ